LEPIFSIADENGNMLSETLPDGTNKETWTYSQFGKMATFTDSSTLTLLSGYDLDNAFLSENVRSTTIQTNYTYDMLDRLR
jgi:hypothetical protein